MEKKLSSAHTKLRNLKELLSSTKSLNQNSINPSPGGMTSSNTDRSSYNNKSKNSVSLFNLVDPPLNSSRPVSVFQEHHHIINGPNKSISMYGLSNNSLIEQNSQIQVRQPRRNPAIRLFYTIRSKFKRRKRETNKIVAKPIEYESPKQSFEDDELEVNGDRECNNAGRYQIQSFNNSRSAENLVVDHFATPLGSRNNNNDDDELINPNEINMAMELSIETHNNTNNSTAEAERDLTLPLPLLEEMKSFTNYAEQPNSTGEELNNYSSSSSHSQENSIPILPIKTTATKKKCLTNQLEDLHHYGWYWGSLSKDEAEEKLRGQCDGAFIVRDSSSDHYLLSLSFNSNGRTLHTRIEYRNGQFCFYLSEADSFPLLPSVAQLIEHCLAYSESGVFCYSKARRSDSTSSYPVRLTKPISRFTEVKSLKQLCVAVIRKKCRLDLLNKLPLPNTLIDYVNEQKHIY